MKFSPFIFITNAVLLIVAAVILVPSFNLDLFGKSFQYPGLDLSSICFDKSVNEETGEEVQSSCLPDFHFSSSSDFNYRSRLILEFTDLNAEDSTVENKEEVYNRNLEILKQRIEIVGIEDVQVNKVVSEDGKYYAEIDFHDNDPLKRNAFSMLSTSGEIVITEDIKDFKPAEDEEASFNFLEGKKPSEILSIKDVKRVRHYFDPTILRGQGGFVVRLDFGDENRDKVMQVAEPTYNTETPFPGIQLVQNGLPIGVQATYIQPIQPGYTGQSYVLFTVWGSPQSSILTRSLASTIITKQVDTTIAVQEENDLDPIFDQSSIELSKIIILLSFVVLGLISILFFKNSGLLLTNIIISQSLVIFAITKILSYTLDSELVFGFIGATAVSIMLLGSIFKDKVSSNKIEAKYLSVRGNVRLFVLLIIIIGAIWEFSRISRYILEPYHAILIFIIALLYGFEVAFRALAPLFTKNK